MDDLRAGIMQAPAFAFGKMDAVGEHASRSQEAEAFVNGGIVAIAGIEPLHRFQLGSAFGEMGLQKDGRVIRKKFARQLQLCLAGRYGETRRYHIARPAPSMPLVQELIAFPGARLRIVVKGRNRIAVHHGLAGYEPHTTGLGGGEKPIGAGLMTRTERHDRRRARSEETGKEIPSALAT